MIRTHIRNLILNVYSVSKNESNVREYLNIFGNDVLKRLAFWQRDQTNILGRYLQLYANTSNNNNNNNNNNSKDKNNNKYNDRIKMMTNDLLDEIYYVSIEETMKTYMYTTYNTNHIYTNTHRYKMFLVQILLKFKVI